MGSKAEAAGDDVAARASIAASERELESIEAQVAALSEEAESPPPPPGMAASLRGILEQVDSLKASMRGE